jgi:hypothetical protein
MGWGWLKKGLNIASGGTIGAASNVLRGRPGGVVRNVLTGGIAPAPRRPARPIGTVGAAPQSPWGAAAQTAVNRGNTTDMLGLPTGPGNAALQTALVNRVAAPAPADDPNTGYEEWKAKGRPMGSLQAWRAAGMP